MSYLPTFCEMCFQTSLVATETFRRKAPLCTQCGNALRVVPSCSYGKADVSLFEELSQSVSMGISSVEAQRLSEEVAGALWGRSFTACFEMLAVRWPALLPVQVAAGNNPTAQHRALKMLKTIFDALGRARASGVMSAVRSSDEAKRVGQG